MCVNILASRLKKKDVITQFNTSCRSTYLLSLICHTRLPSDSVLALCHDTYFAEEVFYTTYYPLFFLAQWFESRNSNPKTLGPIPWRIKVRYSVCFFCSSESTLVQNCLCLTPLRVCMARTQSCTHVKDPISICRKEYASQPVVWIHEQNCAQGGKGRVAPYYGCSLSPGKAARISRAFHWVEIVM